MRIPGETLPPGTYLFLLGTPVGGQTVIDIYTGDATKLVATCLGVQTRLPRPAEATMLDYPSTSPSALRAWFHPANAIGFEFVYTAAEAKALLLQSGVSVPFAEFKTINRELVGAFPIAMSGSAGASATHPVGTVGALPVFNDAMGPHDHLTSARRVITNQLPTITGMDHAKLVLLRGQVEALQRTYRERPKDVPKYLDVVERSISNLLSRDARIVNYAEASRTDAATFAVIERVRAHVRAFSRVKDQRASSHQ